MYLAVIEKINNNKSLKVLLRHMMLLDPTDGFDFLHYFNDLPELQIGFNGVDSPSVQMSEHSNKIIVNSNVCSRSLVFS